MNKGVLGFPKKGGPPRVWTVIDEYRARRDGDLIYFRGIRQDFTHLQLLVVARGMGASTNASGLLRFNGDASAIYDYQTHTRNDVTTGGGQVAAQTSAYGGQYAGATATANKVGSNELLIPDYRSPFHKTAIVRGGDFDPAVLTFTATAQVAWRDTRAITQIELHYGAIATGWAAGSIATLLAI